MKKIVCFHLFTIQQQNENNMRSNPYKLGLHNNNAPRCTPTSISLTFEAKPPVPFLENDALLEAFTS